MPSDGDGDLVAEDVVLGFEVRGDDADYCVKSRLWVRSKEKRVCTQELRESGSGKSTLGGYVEGAT